MPYQTEWVDPEVVVTVGAVNVYNTYRDDDVGQGSREYFFTVCHICGENDRCEEHEKQTDRNAVFDIRDLPEFPHKAHSFDAATVLLAAIASGSINDRGAVKRQIAKAS
jgi:hypothetical protein